MNNPSQILTFLKGYFRRNMVRVFDFPESSSGKVETNGGFRRTGECSDVWKSPSNPTHLTRHFTTFFNYGKHETIPKDSSLKYNSTPHRIFPPFLTSFMFSKQDVTRSYEERWPMLSKPNLVITFIFLPAFCN